MKSRGAAQSDRKRLAEMLSSLLGLDQVGITDNFFMLGGHSLLGTQLSRLRGALGELACEHC